MIIWLRWRLRALKERRVTSWGLFVALAMAYVTATVRLGSATKEWNAVIYFLTGLILLWYTWETREIRIATLRQSALLIRPFLAIEYGEDRKIWINNLGKGVARDIVCHNVILDIAQPGDTVLTVHWQPIDFLPEGQRRELKAEGAFEEGEERAKASQRMEVWLANFGPRGRAQYEFVVDYADLTGKRYRAVVKIDRGHTELVRDAEL